MKFACNRFAIIPCMCADCKRYIWMEPYRYSDTWNDLRGSYLKEKLCKDCLPRYLPYDAPRKKSRLVAFWVKE